MNKLVATLTNKRVAILLVIAAVVVAMAGVFLSVLVGALQRMS